MAEITQRELLCVEELLEAEALAIRKCQMFAEQCRDSELRRLFQHYTQQHQNHYNTLLTHLNAGSVITH